MTDQQRRLPGAPAGTFMGCRWWAAFGAAVVRGGAGCRPGLHAEDVEELLETVYVGLPT